jgi:hypothetical protein
MQKSSIGCVLLAAVNIFKMDCQKIESIINDLKVDSLGRIRGKNKVIDKIHAEHLKKVDSDLMDIRVYVAKLSTGHSTTEALKMIDDFIYKMSVTLCAVGVSL